MYGNDQSASQEISGVKNLIESIIKMKKAFHKEILGVINKEKIPIAKKLRVLMKI